MRPAGVFGDDGPDVYLREEGAHVDGKTEHDGEVLSMVLWGCMGMALGWVG